MNPLSGDMQNDFAPGPGEALLVPPPPFEPIKDCQETLADYLSLQNTPKQVSRVMLAGEWVEWRGRGCGLWLGGMVVSLGRVQCQAWSWRSAGVDSAAQQLIRKLLSPLLADSVPVWVV